MGFLRPDEPALDLATWRTGTRSERIRPLARHLTETGFGTPDVVHLFYLVKIGLYVLGGALVAMATTEGIGGWSEIGEWWSDPIVFRKVVLFTILFEVLGLGCGFGPLNLRFLPPLGAFLYWLRPGTVRLPPWPSRVPLTAGTTRGPVDVALYAALLGTTTWTLVTDASATKVAVVLAVLAAVGLRDKTVFLAARAEVYGALALTFLLDGSDGIVAAQLVMVAIWWGAATSKLNRHFPFVVAMMMSNSPVCRSRRLKRRFHRQWPDDLRPSRISTLLAHGGTAVEFGGPLVLLLSDGGPLTTAAAILMVAFHLNIIAAIPMGTPLEWNVFMIFGMFTLFVDKAEHGPGDLSNPWPVLALVALLATTVALGNARPDKVSFLPGMRYYAGNWDTTVWCLQPAAVEKIEARITKAAQLPHLQLEKLYGEQAEVSLYTGYAFRGMHPHGRAHNTLVPRACGPGFEDAYVVLDGETVAGAVLGWNFGDGHLHDERLLRALHERCAFEPGEVRLIELEAQPIQRQSQRYRIVDAATGELERGTVRIADLVSRQPWADDVPVHVTSPEPDPTSATGRAVDVPHTAPTERSHR